MLKPPEKAKAIKSFHAVFQKSIEKMEKHLEMHPAKEYYKAGRVFDPRLLPTVSHAIAEYTEIPQLESPSQELREEWEIYTRSNIDDIPSTSEGGLDLTSYWKGNSSRFPSLAEIAREVLWMPVASVDVERSFSQYKHLLNDHRHSLSESNTKQLIMLYFNGDIESRFE